MAYPCVLQGGRSYTADTESMFIGNVACCEPGVSGVGWVWIDVGHLELTVIRMRPLAPKVSLWLTVRPIMLWLPSP